MADLEVSLNLKRCQAYGACVKAAPEAFDIAEGEKVKLLSPQNVSDGDLLRAAKECPYRAITIANRTTGEQLYPPARK